MTRIKRFLKFMTMLASVSIFLLLFVLWQGWESFHEKGSLTEQTVLTIPKGSALPHIAKRLSEHGVIESPLLFRIGVRLNGDSARLKAGEYRFPAAISMQEAASILISGQTVSYPLTVPEGLTVHAVAEILLSDEKLTGDIATLPEEGTLLPETYHFSRGENRGDLLKRMARDRRKILDELWANKAEDLPFTTKEEAVILASIVEKETGIAEERPMIAGVFSNRLKKRMRLQSDPTVIYAFTNGTAVQERKISKKDLKTDHPYNTYSRYGLPPGPICNPGIDSLKAVLNPIETDALYFVANGTGGHVFAPTLKEHNRNVQQWRRMKSLKP